MLQLAAGHDLAGAAAALGVTLNTAKTHLARAFARTGTARQAELAAAVLKGPAGLVAASETR